MPTGSGTVQDEGDDGMGNGAIGVGYLQIIRYPKSSLIGKQKVFLRTGVGSTVKNGDIVKFKLDPKQVKGDISLHLAEIIQLLYRPPS